MDKLKKQIEKAKELAASGYWGEEAIQCNLRILEIDDQIGGSYTRLAHCFELKGKLQSAEEMYIKVLEFEPNDRIALNGIERIKNQLDEEKKKDLIGEIDNYEEAFSIGLAAKHKDKVLSLSALKRAVELNPTIYALNALAAAYRANKDLDSAERVYKDILLKTKNNVSLIGLAAVYRDKLDFDKALKIYQKVLHQNSKNIYALNGLGGVYTDIDKWGLAEKMFEKAIQIAIEINSPVETPIQGLRSLQQKYQSQDNQKGIERINLILNRFGD